MAKNYAAQRNKLEREIRRLTKQVEGLKVKERSPVITKIVRNMKQYNITPDEIAKAFGSKQRMGKTVGLKKSASARRTKNSTIQPKYRKPETGETWSGRGRPPAWIVAAESAGQRRDEFLIDNVTTSQQSETNPSSDQ